MGEHAKVICVGSRKSEVSKVDNTKKCFFVACAMRSLYFECVMRAHVIFLLVATSTFTIAGAAP